MGFFTKILGIDDAKDAQKRSAKILEKSEDERMELARQLIAEGADLRTAANAAGLDLLSSDPGTSALFQTGLKRGTKAIFRNLAPFGLTDSSTTGEAVGELTSGLLGEEFRSRLNLIQSATGQGIVAGTNLSGQAGNLVGARAGILSRSPSAEFKSGLFSDFLGATGFAAGSFLGKPAPVPA